MHEMSIAQSMIEVIREEMLKAGASVLRSVRIEIGEMSGIVPDSLSFCFEVMTKETPLEGAGLYLDVAPLRARCRGCGETFDIEGYCFSCPSCDSGDIEVISGRDLKIVEIEVD